MPRHTRARPRSKSKYAKRRGLRKKREAKSHKQRPKSSKTHSRLPESHEDGHSAPESHDLRG